MAKNLKLHIKNVQIADAINLRGLKAKLSKKKEGEEEGIPDASAEAHIEDAASKPKRAKSEAKGKVAAKESAKEPVKEVAKAPSKLAPKAAAKAKAEGSAPVEAAAIEHEPAPIKTPAAKPAPAKAVASKAIEQAEDAPQAIPHAQKPHVLQPATQATSIQAKTSPVSNDARQAQMQPSSAPRAMESAKPAAPAQTHGSNAAASTGATPGFTPGSAPGGPTIRPVQPQASRPVGSWRSVNPSRYTPPPPPTTPQPKLGPVTDRPPLTAPRPQAPREGQGRPPYQGHGQGRPPYQSHGHGQPHSGGYQQHGHGQGHGGQPHHHGPRPPYGQGSYAGGPPRRPPGAPGSRPPFGRPQAPPQPKPEARAVPEKKEFTNKEIEESLFRRSKTKPKEAPAKPLRKIDTKEFEVRIRHGLRGDEEEEGWRKRRPNKQHRMAQEQEIIRPTNISIRLPIMVKDLASEMKLKASQLISKIFLQGVVVTLNDFLADETVVQLLGQEFGCEIVIDTKEEERIRITDKTVQSEIDAVDPALLVIRPPVVAFMGHVDHGKTSLIDAIRKSNVAQHEVGAITQHIGAFRCHTSHGDIAILDTPGHEAFSHMRERGAEITDIVVLVIAGDEGIKQQTEEALTQAKASKATIVVAINKSDKPAFNQETVFRQLADRELLPETWGGQTITVNTSAVTGQGINELLEMLALQAEVLELRANPTCRARGTVIESEVEKGLGPVATVLVQNGTLRVGDSLVFGYHMARVKTMKDENGNDVAEAGPSTPVRINGLSGLPEAGEEFIVVKSDREAREISQARHEGKRTTTFQAKKRTTLESMMEQAQDGPPKKTLTLIVRADVQGSAEALKNALERIESKKVEVNIISCGVGQISESDVQLAVASKAVILGFHTQIESHVESEIKELGIQVRSHDIIYHAIDDVKAMMLGLLDKIEQARDVGKAEVKATFKSSQLGLIAGCQVIDGTITRNNQVRVMREGNQIWKGPIASLKRVKDDVREVTKGAECGILLQGFSEFQQGDILEAYEVIYLTQEL